MIIERYVKVYVKKINNVLIITNAYFEDNSHILPSLIGLSFPNKIELVIAIWDLIKGFCYVDIQDEN